MSTAKALQDELEHQQKRQRLEDVLAQLRVALQKGNQDEVQRIVSQMQSEELSTDFLLEVFQQEIERALQEHHWERALQIGEALSLISDAAAEESRKRILERQAHILFDAAGRRIWYAKRVYLLLGMLVVLLSGLLILSGIARHEYEAQISQMATEYETQLFGMAKQATQLYATQSVFRTQVVDLKQRAATQESQVQYWREVGGQYRTMQPTIRYMSKRIEALTFLESFLETLQNNTTGIEPTDLIQIMRYITTARKVAEIPRGELKHERDGYIEEYCASVKVDNFIAMATFYNPYSLEVHSWDYGFLFRHVGWNKQFRLSVSSSGRWWLKYGLEASIQEGYVENLRTGEDDFNTIILVVYKDKGYWFLNDLAISKLDVSYKLKPGKVCVATEMWKRDEVSGKMTRFEDFIIFRLFAPVVLDN